MDVRWQEVPRPFVQHRTVVDADIDVQGRASNVAFVQWINASVILHSLDVGLDLPTYERLGGMFVVRRHVIDYVGAAFLGDELEIATWTIYLHGGKAERRHQIRRVQGGAILARAQNIWAWVDARTGRPCRMPEEVLRAFDPGRHGVGELSQKAEAHRSHPLAVSALGCVEPPRPPGGRIR